jgi:hypothetical protein
MYVLFKSLSQESQNIPCTTLKGRGLWVISVHPDQMLIRNSEQQATIHNAFYIFIHKINTKNCQSQIWQHPHVIFYKLASKLYRKRRRAMIKY